MKKALLPALIAALFAANAGAAEREFLFGPSEAPATVTKQAIKKSPAPVVAVKKDQTVKTAPVIAAAKPAAPAPVVVTKPAAPVVVVKKDEPKAKLPVVAAAVAAHVVASAPVVVAKKPDTKPAAPVVVVQKDEPKAKLPIVAVAPVAAHVVTPAPAPVIVAKKPDAKPVAVVKKEEPKTLAKLTPVQAAAPAPASIPVLATAIAGMTSVQRPSAAVFSSEGGSGKKTASVSDAFSERAYLSKKLPNSVVVGFFSPPTGNQDAFSFQQNYLPIANYLSARSGALLNLIPERNLGKFRNHINDARYPVVFVNAALARDASKAGYIPLAVGAEELAPGFLARADGKFKSLDDLNGARISYSRNAQTGMLAQSVIAKRGLGNAVTFADVGALGYSAAVNDLHAKLTDVIVVRSNQVDDLVKKSNGEFISIGKGEGAPSAGLWVRQDFAGTDVANKLRTSILEVSPDADGSAKFASIMFSRGFGVRGQFVAPTADYALRMTSILDAAEKNFGTYFSEPLVSNEKIRLANIAIPALKPRTAESGSDAMSARGTFIAKMKEGMNVGLFLPGSDSQDIYMFQTNFMPLSNYLSDQAGVLVSLVPERNGNDFIRRISDNTYPAILIGPSMAYAAVHSGYLPTARAGNFISPGFLVPAQSSIKTIADLKNKRLATVRSSDAATVGRWELLKLDVTGTAFEFFGASSEGPRVLNSGAADAVLVRSTEALEMAAKLKTIDGKPLYRAIIGTEKVPAASFWVRQDAYDAGLIKSLANSFHDFDGVGGQIKAKAFAGFVRGFGVNESWQSSGIKEHTSSVEMVEGLIKAKASLVDEPVKNVGAVEKNRKLPLTYPLIKSSGFSPILAAGTTAAVKPVVSAPKAKH